MQNAILVLNAGSSSLKFSLFADHPGGPELRLRGQIEGSTVRRTSSPGTPRARSSTSGAGPTAPASATTARPTIWSSSCRTTGMNTS
ncbi:hypothetical protein ACFSHR_15685 [Azotobacter chroococcum]